jgi:hypothetical protein
MAVIRYKSDSGKGLPYPAVVNELAAGLNARPQKRIGSASYAYLLFRGGLKRLFRFFTLYAKRFFIVHMLPRLYRGKGYPVMILWLGYVKDDVNIAAFNKFFGSFNMAYAVLFGGLGRPVRQLIAYARKRYPLPEHSRKIVKINSAYLSGAYNPYPQFTHHFLRLI